jgi:serine/threonine protein kinase
MLYEMLTGHRAFHGDTLISTISSMLKDTPAPVHHLRREIAPPLEAIVDRCLEKHREARYASGAERRWIPRLRSPCGRPCAVPAWPSPSPCSPLCWP